MKIGSDKEARKLFKKLLGSIGKINVNWLMQRKLLGEEELDGLTFEVQKANMQEFNNWEKSNEGKSSQGKQLRRQIRKVVWTL